MAAEELIKTKEEVTTIAPSPLVHDVTSISLESKLDILNQKLSSLETSTNVKLSELRTQIALQTKHQRLDWAYANVDTVNGNFSYVNRDEKTRFRRESNNFVKSILPVFRRDSGVRITNLAHFNAADGKDGKAEFRTAIVEQLHGLLGTKPRLVYEGGNWNIYYE